MPLVFTVFIFFIAFVVFAYLLQVVYRSITLPFTSIHISSFDKREDDSSDEDFTLDDHVDDTDSE